MSNFFSIRMSHATFGTYLHCLSEMQMQLGILYFNLLHLETLCLAVVSQAVGVDLWAEQERRNREAPCEA